MADQPQGNGAPQAPQGTGAPAALDEEKVAQIAAQVVNSAFSTRGKKLREDISADVTKSLEGVSKKFEEMFAAAASSGKGKGKGKDGDEPSDDPKLNSLQRELKELRAENEAAKKERDAEKSARAAMALRQRLAEELGVHGITEPARVKGATALLLSANQVRYDDDGQIVFAESENSLLDLPTGIKAWAKTDDAKIYMPPSGARGSGDRGGAGGKPPPSPQGEPSATDIGLALVKEFGGISVGG